MSRYVETWRHLFAAVTVLATMPGSVAERLEHAYWDALRKVTINPGVPAELRTEFAQMMSRLETLYPAREARKVDPREAVRIAKQILRLYDRMSRLT